MRYVVHAKMWKAYKEVLDDDRHSKPKIIWCHKVLIKHNVDVQLTCKKPLWWFDRGSLVFVCNKWH